jgi:hypothetical protein
VIVALTLADEETPEARDSRALSQQFWRTPGLCRRTVRWIAVASSPDPAGGAGREELPIRARNSLAKPDFVRGSGATDGGATVAVMGVLAARVVVRAERALVSVVTEAASSAPGGIGS